jgi:putative peptidoglycan lipid II flippase
VSDVIARGRGSRVVVRSRALLARFLPEGALLLSILTFGAYVMGLLRDRIFARTFGLGIQLDAYNAAFQLPELVLDVVVAGGLAAPFVPIFSGLRRDDESAAHDFGRTVLTLAVLFMAASCAVLFLVAPFTAGLLVPGFDAAQRDLYVGLFRVMLLSPILFAASIALGEILVAEQRFAFYGLAPLLYNAGIIIGTVTLNGPLGIYAPAVGALLGAALHLGIRVVGIWRTRFRYRPQLAIHSKAIRTFLRLMVPKMASHPIDPLTFLFFNALATTFGAGYVSGLSFARNFESVPVSLIGAAFSVAAFPLLSRAFAAGDRPAFLRLIRTNALTIGGLSIVSALGLIIVGELAIRVFLGGGRFTEADIALTGNLLVLMALSVPFEALTHLLARALYATRTTILPVGASFAGFAVTVAVAAALVGPVGVIAIPIAYTLGMAVKLTLLVAALLPRARAVGRTGAADDLRGA